MADLLRDLDFFHLDDLLTDEEKMARDTTKRFVDREILPQIEQQFAKESFPMHLVPQMAELGNIRSKFEGLRMRRDEQRRVRTDHAGTRGRRLRTAVVRVGPECAFDVRDLCQRQ